MQEISVTVQFNRHTYMDGQQIIWRLMYKSVSASYMIYMAVTALVVIIGIVVDSRGGFPITSIVAAGMVITILLRFRHVYAVKKAFFGRAAAVAGKYENALKTYTYTFNDEGLTYADKERALKLAWPLFEPVTLLDDALVLYLKEEDKVHAIITRAEVGDAHYNAIYNILKERTGVSIN